MKRVNRQQQKYEKLPSMQRVEVRCIMKNTVKRVLSGHSKRTPKIGFKYQLSLNAGQKYCRMLQGEHSAILSTFIKLPFVIKETRSVTINFFRKKIFSF